MGRCPIEDYIWFLILICSGLLQLEKETLIIILVGGLTNMVNHLTIKTIANPTEKSKAIWSFV